MGSFSRQYENLTLKIATGVKGSLFSNAGENGSPVGI
jgi:hypothetical protein